MWRSQVSTQRISLSAEPGTTKKGMELVTEVIDPEIRRFEEWFGKPENGNSSLTGMEREVMRSYLYQKLTGVL